jgi:(4-(4-[2-(gamma-L-glutamylamino)ethyl]phenoxymethyl)furan-2-yl)methanamine synthase
MGVAQRATLKGRLVGLAREYLATMADVRRVLGWDLAELDLHATADGRGKSVEESLSRLARMYGCDAEDYTPRQWRTAAAHLREIQLGSITEGALQVLSAKPLPGDTFVVAAGIGAREAAEISRRLQMKCETFGEMLGLSGALDDAATHHAPAVAVAWLLDN